MFEIVSKTKLADKVWRMDVVAPLVAGKAMPGQFLIIRVDKDGERIPLTVCDFDREKGIVTIVFQTVGAETERMSRVEVGECFADVVGPLGRPSDLCDLQYPRNLIYPLSPKARKAAPKSSPSQG